jgi:hypothetical protein
LSQVLRCNGAQSNEPNRIIAPTLAEIAKRLGRNALADVAAAAVVPRIDRQEV